MGLRINMHLFNNDDNENNNGNGNGNGNGSGNGNVNGGNGYGNGNDNDNGNGNGNGNGNDNSNGNGNGNGNANVNGNDMRCRKFVSMVGTVLLLHSIIQTPISSQTLKSCFDQLLKFLYPVWTTLCRFSSA